MIYQLDNIPKLVEEILEQRNKIKNIAKIIYKKKAVFSWVEEQIFPLD